MMGTRTPQAEPLQASAISICAGAALARVPVQLKLRMNAD